MAIGLSSKSIKEFLTASSAGLRAFFRRSKVPLLLLVYPVFAWLLIVTAPPMEGLPEFAQELIEPLTMTIYTLMGIGLGYCIAVPLWASRYRRRPALLPRALKRGLYATFAFIALLLPAQALVLAFSIHISGSQELWIWSLFVLGGSIAATVILLRSGLRDKPGIYATLRVKRLELSEHPRLAQTMQDLSEALQAPLPRHIVAGLQPETLTVAGTVFCPDGELEGGVLCLSLPLARITSMAEFSAVVGENMLALHASGNEARLDLQSNVEQARQVVSNLQASLDHWRWFPKYFLHPYFIALRFVPVAAMKFHLYLGKEIVVFLVNQFLESRSYADGMLMMTAHQLSSAHAGRVEVLTGLMKEASLSLGAHFALWNENGSLHPLGDVEHKIREQYTSFTVDVSQPSQWRHPVLAWKHLELRCQLSRLSLQWCLQMAKDVAPAPSALSLFENVAELENQLLEILDKPFVMAKQRAAGEAG